jgi:hypothetical protein
VAVRVVSHSPAQEHPAFRAIRNRPASPGDIQRRVSLEAATDADRRRFDPGAASMPAVDDQHNPKDIPGQRVRQQTLDLAGWVCDCVTTMDVHDMTSQSSTYCDCIQ